LCCCWVLARPAGQPSWPATVPLRPSERERVMEREGERGRERKRRGEETEKRKEKKKKKRKRKKKRGRGLGPPAALGRVAGNRSAPPLLLVCSTERGSVCGGKEREERTF